MKQTIANGASYTTIETVVAGNTWQIMRVVGAHNYVSVCKVTNNPYGGRMGKDFANFATAAKHYKSPAMKTALLMAEIEFEAAERAEIIAEIDRRAKLN